MTMPSRSTELTTDSHARNTEAHDKRKPGQIQRIGVSGDASATPRYYDVPMLKPPVWKWEIASYFFLGGISAGAYVLARLAARFGPERYRDVTDAGTAIALAALLPCPVLLIHDLGDPKRFHYMLRVFKPESPMNLGSWTLSGYGAMATLAALNQWRKSRRGVAPNGAGVEPSQAMRLADEAIETLLDGAGIPLALLLAGYTGVLLNTTATPMWTRNAWIGPLFSAGAISTGLSAINLVREAQNAEAAARPAHQPLKRVEGVARAAEAVTLAGYLATAGNLAEPVTKGKYAPHLWGGAVGAGLVGATILGNVPLKSDKSRRIMRIAGAVAGLAGGLALRWAISQGGRPSGNDPHAARQSSRGDRKRP